MSQAAHLDEQNSMSIICFMEKNGKLLRFLRGYRGGFLSMPNLSAPRLKTLIMLFICISNGSMTLIIMLEIQVHYPTQPLLSLYKQQGYFLSLASRPWNSLDGKLFWFSFFYQRLLIMIDKIKTRGELVVK